MSNHKKNIGDVNNDNDIDHSNDNKALMNLYMLFKRKNKLVVKQRKQELNNTKGHASFNRKLQSDLER